MMTAEPNCHYPEKPMATIVGVVVVRDDLAHVVVVALAFVLVLDVGVVVVL